MVGQLGAGGFEPRTSPPERRDFFDLRRQITEINANIAALDTRVDALETLTTPSTWTAVTFENSWVDFGGSLQVCQYRKVGDMVHVRGAAKSGTIDTAIFTLPTGFRPPAQLNITVEAGVAGGAGVVNVSTAGVVKLSNAYGATNAYCVMNFQFSVTS